jgi:hypothetical protein
MRGGGQQCFQLGQGDCLGNRMNVPPFKAKETLNKSSFRRRIKYKLLIFMDSRLRGNDEF